MKNDNPKIYNGIEQKVGFIENTMIDNQFKTAPLKINMNNQNETSSLTIISKTEAENTISNYNFEKNNFLANFSEKLKCHDSANTNLPTDFPYEISTPSETISIYDSVDKIYEDSMHTDAHTSNWAIKNEINNSSENLEEQQNQTELFNNNCLPAISSNFESQHHFSHQKLNYLDNTDVSTTQFDECQNGYFNSETFANFYPNPYYNNSNVTFPLQKDSPSSILITENGFHDNNQFYSCINNTEFSNQINQSALYENTII